MDTPDLHFETVCNGLEFFLFGSELGKSDMN